MCLSGNKSNVSTSKDSKECITHKPCTVNSLLIEAPVLHTGLQSQNGQKSERSYNRDPWLHIFIQ
jgi:hypothetical protein